MNKVYFDKEKNYWFVNEPEDMYLFKTTNCKTNEEVNQILSWSRGFKLTNYPQHIRVYDVEIERIKYFFLMKNEGNRYIIESEDPTSLERLTKQENLIFTGTSVS